MPAVAPSMTIVENVLITRYVGDEVTLEHLALGYEATQDLLRQFPLCGSLSVLPAQLHVPGEAVRAKSREMLHAFGDRLACAVAMEGEDLVSVTKRTVAATVFLLARAPQAKVFANAEDGAAWLAGRLADKGPPVIKMLEGLRGLTQSPS